MLTKKGEIKTRSGAQTGILRFKMEIFVYKMVAMVAIIIIIIGCRWLIVN